MFPVLFSVGSFSISSLGVLLGLGFFYSIFLIWRLARAFEFNEEKVLDIALLTSLGAFIVSRLYFILQYLEYFTRDFARIFLVFKYPGFSFWGAFLGGWLTLYFVVRKLKLDFAVIIDIASVGFLGMLIFGNLGCLLGGCGVGVSYSGVLAVNMAGNVGTRFPVQALEALALVLLLSRIWPKATHFHTPGTIASKVLMYVGVIKFFTEFLRSQNQGGQVFSLVLVALGVTIYYKFSRKSARTDLSKFALTLKLILTDKTVRKSLLQNLPRSWYNEARLSLRNELIALRWRFRNFNKILRKINVKSHPKNY